MPGVVWCECNLIWKKTDILSNESREIDKKYLRLQTSSFFYLKILPLYPTWCFDNAFFLSKLVMEIPESFEASSRVNQECTKCIKNTFFLNSHLISVFFCYKLNFTQFSKMSDQHQPKTSKFLKIAEVKKFDFRQALTPKFPWVPINQIDWVHI